MNIGIRYLYYTIFLLLFIQMKLYKSLKVSMSTESFTRNIKKSRKKTNERMISVTKSNHKKLLLFSSVTTIKGIGSKYEKILNNFGIKTVSDILLHFPINVLDWNNYIDDLSNYQPSILSVYLFKVETIKEGHGNIPHVIKCIDSKNNKIKLIFYNYDSYPHLWYDIVDKYKVGSQILVRGIVKQKTLSLYEMFNPNQIHLFNNMKGNKYQVEALYKVAPGLGMNRMKSFISEARLIAQQEIGNDDWLDSSFRIENGWKTPLIAIDNMHSPKSVNDLLLSNKNYERLAFDELLALELQREENIKQSIDNTTTSFALVGPTTLTQSLIKSLPFELTVSQLKSIDNILNDLADTKRMVHLLQGDVCSGKSIVAFIALFRAVECGKQGILLAPVELLVTQFYNNLQQLLNNLASKNLTIKIPTIGYITGSVKGDDRINLLENIRNGNCDIIIGTQALFTESVFQSISNNLGLVVVDEEQRFGVNQRKELSELTNVLFTTATPIPRSLTIFNEKQLSVSTLTDMPLYRRTIQTVLIGLSRVDDLLLRIDEHIKFDSKFYWVTDSIDSSCNQLRGSAIDRFELLSKRYPNKVGLLHGQLKSEEKDQVMKSFILNEIQILVCTSVIEVGIDVSDVSFCIIERPERFGLSQLHQIRGRIGRGKAPKNENIENCFCVLLYDDINSTSQPVILSNAHNVDSDMIIPYTKPPKEKLEYLVKCNNGFDIAELDLQLRGPGDIFGIKQSGHYKYRVAKLPTHKYLLFLTRSIAEKIVNGTYNNGIRMEDERIQILLQLYKLKDDSIVTESLTEEKISKTNDKKSTLTVKSLPSHEFTILHNKPDLDLDDNIIIILDIETSGLSTKRDRIIQLGACIYDDPSAQFNRYVNPPNIKLDNKIIEITGITNELLNLHGDLFDNVWIDFHSWINEIRDKRKLDLNITTEIPVIFIAHNGKKFDFQFLQNEINNIDTSAITTNHWTRTSNTWFVDSLTLMRDKTISTTLENCISKAPSNYKLNHLYEYIIGKPLLNNHNAIVDVLALYEILHHDYIELVWKDRANNILFHINEVIIN